MGLLAYALVGSAAFLGSAVTFFWLLLADASLRRAVDSRWRRRPIFGDSPDYGAPTAAVRGSLVWATPAAFLSSLAFCVLHEGWWR